MCRYVRSFASGGVPFAAARSRIGFSSPFSPTQSFACLPRFSLCRECRGGPRIRGPRTRERAGSCRSETRRCRKRQSLGQPRHAFHRCGRMERGRMQRQRGVSQSCPDTISPGIVLRRREWDGLRRREWDELACEREPTGAAGSGRQRRRAGRAFP